MQATLCDYCEQNLRKYYIGCLHNVFGPIHDHITRLLLRSYCLADDKRSDDMCPCRINELHTYLEMISRLQSIDTPMQWSLMDGIMAIAEFTFTEHNDRYKKEKGREITSSRNIVYEIMKDTTPPVNMFDSMSGTATEKKPGDNIEHVTPQSMYECQRKSSLSNCFHVIDPFNMLYLDEKVNNKRANYPYGTINRCAQSLAKNTQELPTTPIVEFHQCVAPKDLKIVEPLSNIGKFIVGTRLLYKKIVYRGLENSSKDPERITNGNMEFEDIFNWTNNIQLSEAEIKSIVAYNKLLYDKWNIQYNYFSPNEIRKLFIIPKQQHKCIDVENPICYKCNDILPITDFMKLIKNILEVLKSQNIILKKMNDIIFLINEFYARIGKKTDLVTIDEKDIIIDKVNIIKKIISAILNLSFSTEKRGLQVRRVISPQITQVDTPKPEPTKEETSVRKQLQIILPQSDKSLVPPKVVSKLRIIRPNVVQTMVSQSGIPTVASSVSTIPSQSGGELMENNKYYKKYLKYKSKYMHLKHLKL